MPEEDLLTSWFEKAIKFIDDCIENDGRILIHCYHGVSRSATILAAYLLKCGIDDNKETQEISEFSCVDSVLSFMKSKRPIICPNEGFTLQLKLWSAMECQLDSSFKPYKMYQLNCIYQKMKSTKILPSPVKIFFQVNTDLLKKRIKHKSAQLCRYIIVYFFSNFRHAVTILPKGLVIPRIDYKVHLPFPIL